MHTKDVLAEALIWAGLPDMASKAREGYYHDFLSPLDLPEIQLALDLRDAKDASEDQLQKKKIDTLIARHMDGAFDASAKESEEWANSHDGREVIQELIHGIKPRRQK